jgi:A/G-specific adenine glycosylase
MNKQLFRDNLLQWYDQSKRILPWRDNPNPYHVWVSEIMLQQTRVDTVIPYFHRFIETLPTIDDLAHVPDDVLTKLWEGLGYYSRARNLKQAAIQIVQDHHSVLPSNYDDLIALKGIGPYTVGAILSIAFNQPYTAVDGNVLRVFSRVLLEEGNIKEPLIKKRIKGTVEKLLPRERVGDFNQALMEIGATVCVPNGRPLCMICPLNSFCEAFKQQRQNEIPVKQPKKQRRIEKRTVFIIEQDHKFLIEKRPEEGLLAGLYQFPNMEGHLTIEDIKQEYPDAVITKLPRAKHIFSHLEWHMVGYHVIDSEHHQNGEFVTLEGIKHTFSIPTAFKSFKNYILGGKQ